MSLEVSDKIRDIVLYGAGAETKYAIPLLEQEYHIGFLVDSNEEKWGTVYENYIVNSPDVLNKCENIIIITASRYKIEIADQLEKSEIDLKRIYFYRRFQLDDIVKYEIYPILENKVLPTSMPLRKYDLYYKEEKAVNCKKVLVACTFFSVYTKQLIENISKRYDDVEISLLTKSTEYKEKIIVDQLKHIYCFQTMADLKTILNALPVYDVMQFLWMEYEWCFFNQSIRKKTRRLNLNVGGSDFYRATQIERDFKKKLISSADYIIAEVEGTVQDFTKYYMKDIQCPVKLLPFGVEVLDYINGKREASKEKIKEKFGIPQSRIVVTCGHNAFEQHQHLEIIEAINQLPENIKSRVVFVFPMTYPERTDSYIETVKDKLVSLGISHVILTEFMDFQKMAEYALISDIMIHVQTTDQLSSTMLEEMYAESVVIAGNWLPYRSLHEMGLYFLDVETISDVTHVLEDVIINLEVYKQKCKGNPKIVRNHSSWDVLAPKWHALWE